MRLFSIEGGNEKLTSTNLPHHEEHSSVSTFHHDMAKSMELIELPPLFAKNFDEGFVCAS